MIRILKVVFALAGTGLVTLCTGLVTGTAAYAAAGVAMSVDVTNSQITMVGGSGGTCEWTVLSTVTLVNLTAAPITVSAVDASADYNGPAGLIGRVSSTIVGDGGLQGGVTIPSNTAQSYPGVQTTSFVPCAATYAQIEFRVNSPGRVNAGDAPFLENGTSVPLRTLAGGAALSVVLGAGFVLYQRRRRSGRVGGLASVDAP